MVAKGLAINLIFYKVQALVAGVSAYLPDLPVLVSRDSACALGDTLRLRGSTTPINGYTSDSVAWVVTLDGLWASEASAPDLTLSITQIPYHILHDYFGCKNGFRN